MVATKCFITSDKSCKIYSWHCERFRENGFLLIFPILLIFICGFLSVERWVKVFVTICPLPTFSPVFLCNVFL